MTLQKGRRENEEERVSKPGNMKTTVQQHCRVHAWQEFLTSTSQFGS